jgi:transposase
METYELLDEKYKEHTKVTTDSSRKDGRVACAIVTPECKTRKRMRSQNTIYSTEQEAIIIKKMLDEEREKVSLVWLSTRP